MPEAPEQEVSATRQTIGGGTADGLLVRDMSSIVTISPSRMPNRESRSGRAQTQSEQVQLAAQAEREDGVEQRGDQREADRDLGDQHARRLT